MLAQRNLKRLLVLSTVEDIGFLFFGLASASTLGLSGAMWGAAVHALAKTLLFAALSAPEASGELEHEGGLAARFPLSGGAFLFGMLAMLGVPPLMGFASRWRLYEAALTLSPWWLTTFIAASALSLIAFVLALTRFWWGPVETAAEVQKEPLLLRSVLVLLIMLLVIGGMWPHLVGVVHPTLPDPGAAVTNLWRLP